MSEPICSSDRWTCPQCGRSVVVYASDADTRCCLRAVQERHTKAHREAATLVGRMGLAESHPPRRKRSA